MCNGNWNVFKGTLDGSEVSEKGLEEWGNMRIFHIKAKFSWKLFQLKIQQFNPIRAEIPDHKLLPF